MGRHVKTVIQLALLTCAALPAPVLGVVFSGQLVGGSDIGRFSSLAFDPAGRLVVSYHDAGNLDHDGPPGGLRLWHDANSNGAFDPGECRTIDNTGATGKWTSLAIDTNGLVTVSYFDYGNENLKLWHDADGDFTFDAGEIQNVDTSGRVGSFASLAFDAGGRATISYYDDDRDDLRLWHDADGDFAFDGNEVRNIDTNGGVGRWTSLQFDTNGRATVSYFDDELDALKLWHDTNGNLDYDTGEVRTIETSGQVGMCTSLRLDTGGRVTVVFYDTDSSELKLWHDIDGNLAFSAGEIQVLDTIGASAPYPALVVDAAGRALVSYYDVTGGNLKRWYDADGDFGYDAGEVETVDSNGTVGEYSALGFDSTGHIVVSHYDSTQHDLRLWCDTNGGLTADPGELRTVDVVGYDVGYSPSAVFDDDGVASVAYIDHATNDLHLWHDADGDLNLDAGEFQTIDQAGSSSTVALAIDYDGRATIAYFDGAFRHQLWHDVDGDHAADSGEISTLGDGTGKYTSLAFDASGCATVGFCDWSFAKLRLWHDADKDFQYDAGELRNIDSNGGDVGRHVSIAFDQQDLAAVAYHVHNPYYELRVWHDADGDFTRDLGEISVIDTPSSPPPDDSTGKYTTIAFDADSHAVVTYYRGTWEGSPGDLRLWHDENGSFAAEAGEITTIDSAGNVGRHAHLALDGAYHAAVLYADTTNQAIKFWHDADGDFTAGPGEIQTLDYAPRAGEHNALAIRPWDQTALIVYYDQDNHGLIVGVGNLPPACLKGDLNDDIAVTPDDVSPFVEVLLGDTPGWRELCAVDVNTDGLQNGADIQGFTTCLTGGPCP